MFQCGDEVEYLITWAELSWLGPSIVRPGLSFPHHRPYRCHSVLHECDVFNEGTVQAGLLLPGLLGQVKDAATGPHIEQLERQEASGRLGDIPEREHEVGRQHIPIRPIPVLHPA